MININPVYIENSKVPVFLSYISPISLINFFLGKEKFEIGAITILWFIFSRGVMSPETKVHESLHVFQGIETFFIGFYILYVWDWLHGMIKYGDPNLAYYSIRAEQEAYANHSNLNYLEERKPRAWIYDYSV